MKNISFVIPCYNEEARLKKTFQALDHVVLPRGLKLAEVIFVNDGSSDKTIELIQSFAGYSKVPVKIVSYSQNKGKGYAIKVGMLASKADFTLFFDADMSTPLSEINKFAPFIKNGTDVIIGTRKNGHSTVIKHQPIYRELLGKGFTRITQFTMNTKITDFTCGFKCFSKKATNAIFSKTVINGWGYDAEIIFLAEKCGFAPREVAVIWANDERTKVRLASAIIKTLLELAQIRFAHIEMPSLKFSNSNFQFPIKSKILINKN